MSFRWLPAVVILLACSALADGIDGAAFVNVGWNKNPALHRSVAAGVQLDASLLRPSRLQPELFNVGISYDRVQGSDGATIDLRARLPFLRCYGWEYKCIGEKKLWLVAVPMIGKRWGGGGLGAFAGGALQAVYDASDCCRIAVGFQHRFPFDSSLRGDNAVTLEVRTFIGFIDRARPRASRR